MSDDVADPSPELATNKEWRGIMARARKDHGLSQAELGTKVLTSQNMISLIESGEVGSSRFVLPICAELSIPPPTHFENEDERAWWQAGHVLRAKSPRRYQRLLDLIREEAAEVDADATGAPSVAPRK